MNEYNRLKALAEKNREQFPAGTRVMLKQMDDPQAPPYGALGTVLAVDDVGTILVQWDCGSTLGVTEIDEVVILERG